MYPTRIVLRPSHGQRVAKAAPSCRGMSSFFPTAASSPFWAPSPSCSRGAALSPFVGMNVNNDIFRLLDESARAFDSLPSLFNNTASEASRVWQPRFDVQEHEHAYELRGELPGVDAQHLDVQFADPSTLVVRGRVETSRSEGTQPQAVAAPTDNDTAMSGAADGAASADNASTTEAAAADDKSDAASVHSDSSYVQPTVEDDVPETASTLTGASNTAAEPTPATTAAESAAAPAEDAAKQAAAAVTPQQEQQPSSHYWLSERRTGSFARTFRFPARVDHDNVSASLRNGVLTITVPKAAEPAPRRIAVL